MTLPDLPDGYMVRRKPARRGVIGARDGWLVSHVDGWTTRVHRADDILPAVARHQADGSPPGPPPRVSRALREEREVREAVAAGRPVGQVAREHRMEVSAVLRLTRSRPQFVDVDQTPEQHGRIPTRRLIRGWKTRQVRFVPDDE